jgi:hypothetical protein
MFHGHGDHGGDERDGKEGPEDEHRHQKDAR